MNEASFSQLLDLALTVGKGVEPHSDFLEQRQVQIGQRPRLHSAGEKSRRPVASRRPSRDDRRHRHRFADRVRL